MIKRLNIWFDALLIAKINSMTTRFLLLLQLLRRENCSQQPNVDISASESPFVVQQHLANIIQTPLKPAIYAESQQQKPLIVPDL